MTRAAGIAHDANNMLAVVLACAEHIAQRLPPNSELASVTVDLQSAALRAHSLLSQLVSLDHRDEVPQRIFVDEVLSSIGRMLRLLLGPGVELQLGAQQGAWPIRANRGRFEDVVINLVCNARDAMNGAGKLAIETSNAELSYGPHVMLAITDTGTGMDEATRLRMFDPFFTTKARGRGLGLTVALQTIKELGGTIVVDTAPGEGTTVRVFLPRDGAV